MQENKIKRLFGSLWRRIPMTIMMLWAGVAAEESPAAPNAVTTKPVPYAMYTIPYPFEPRGEYT